MIESSEGIEAVHEILERIQLMFRFSGIKISLAASALLLGAGLAQATTLPGSPLTAAPASVSIGFTLPSTAGSAQAVVLTVPTANVSDPFVIDPTTVPFWLSILTSDLSAPDLSDTAVPSPGLTINFVASAAAGTLGNGAYKASVHVKVNGYQDLVVPVTLTVTGSNSTLSVMNGATAVASAGTVATTWVYGAALPTVNLTLLSSDNPIGFTAASTVNGTSPEDWILLSNSSGIAYNYGTPLTITFAQDALTNAAVGSTLSGTVTISYGSSTYTVNLTVLIGEPAPTVTNVFPQEVPLTGAGAVTVVVTGTGFGTIAQGFTTATTVKIAYGAVSATNLVGITAKTGGGVGAVTVVNPTTMILTIPWEDGTPVSILNTAQTVTISITNGLTSEVPITANLYVTNSPVIYSISDAAALTEPTPGSKPNVAPYEIISIFGNNFCPTCVAPVVAPVSSGRYPTTLTAPVTSGHPLTVTFYQSDGSTLVGNAYILFANNTQINALVPSTAVPADNPMQVVVSYNGVVSNANVLYEANAVAANPGIFTTSSSGQGQGAILLANGTVNSDAGATTKAAPGSTVLIYLSGMGATNSTTADTASTKAAKYPTSCVSLSSYITTAALSPASLDGVVLDPTQIATNLLPPCFVTAPTVTIGGAAAAVTYAGWVSGSVAGLYQINATVPTKALAGDLPVVVTVGTGTSAVSSQTGVTVAVN